MHFKTTINANWETSDGKKMRGDYIFRRYEFNHPLNPFRFTIKENRMPVHHPKSVMLNEGVLSYFEKQCHVIQRIVETPAKKNTQEMDLLIGMLDHALTTYSTMPCTSNIDAEIFEHMNYVLRLLHEWKGYASLFEEADQDLEAFYRKASLFHQLELEVVIAKMNYLRRLFIELSREIIRDVKVIKKRIKEAYNKPLLP